MRIISDATWTPTTDAPGVSWRGDRGCYQVVATVAQHGADPESGVVWTMIARAGDLTFELDVEDEGVPPPGSRVAFELRDLPGRN